MGDAPLKDERIGQGDHEVLKVRGPRHVLSEAGEQTIVAAFKAGKTMAIELSLLEREVGRHAGVEHAEVREYPS